MACIKVYFVVSFLTATQEWNIYCDWHNFLLDAFGGLKLDGLVYLRANPQVGHQESTALFNEFDHFRRALIACRSESVPRFAKSHVHCSSLGPVALQEGGVPLPYLESIHQRHEEWLIQKSIKSVALSSLSNGRHHELQGRQGLGRHAYSDHRLQCRVRGGSRALPGDARRVPPLRQGDSAEEVAPTLIRANIVVF